MSYGSRIWRVVRLVVSLAIFVPIFALVGYDRWTGHWYGVLTGGLVGQFFGLVLGGNPDWKIWNSIFGPKEQKSPDDR